MCDLITPITFQYGCLNKPSNDKGYYYEDMLPVQPLAAINGFRENKIGFNTIFVHMQYCTIKKQSTQIFCSNLYVFWKKYIYLLIRLKPLVYYCVPKLNRSRVFQHSVERP